MYEYIQQDIAFCDLGWILETTNFQAASGVESKFKLFFVLCFWIYGFMNLWIYVLLHVDCAGKTASALLLALIH